MHGQNLLLEAPLALPALVDPREQVERDLVDMLHAMYRINVEMLRRVESLEQRQRLCGAMYVYLESQEDVYSVGLFDPAGRWIPESDHPTEGAAAARVNFLNGGKAAEVK